MALVIAEGLKAMNFTQLPVTTSEQGRPSHSRGKTDGYARKSRERSNSEVPNVIRTSGNGRSEKFGGSTQEGYEQGSYSQQVPNVKVNDAYSYDESPAARVPNDAHPYGGIHSSTGRFPGAKSNENYPYSEMHGKSVGASSAKPGENYQYGGKHGSMWRPSKGHQSSGYPPAYQRSSYSNDSNDSERPDVPSYGQAITFQQIPYAQQPYQYRDNQASVGRGPYYDGRSSSSSDSLRYSDSDRSF